MTARVERSDVVEIRERRSTVLSGSMGQKRIFIDHTCKASAQECEPVSEPMVLACPQADIPRPADLPIVEFLLPSASVDSGFYDRGDGSLNTEGMERSAQKSIHPGHDYEKNAYQVSQRLQGSMKQKEWI